MPPNRERIWREQKLFDIVQQQSQPNPLFNIVDHIFRPETIIIDRQIWNDIVMAGENPSIPIKGDIYTDEKTGLSHIYNGDRWCEIPSTTDSCIEIVEQNKSRIELVLEDMES